MSMYGVPTKRTRKKLSYADIDRNIKHAEHIEYLADCIVKLVEWRENHAEDENYPNSKDLLIFAFDKYEDLCNKREEVTMAPFCSFLNEV